ncbi:DnaJ domain-containing protein [Mycena amicta]|nr:DnaJ domain-containing protein [Mycena amicta]
MYRRSFCSSSCRRATTHYEMLGLPRDASPAQIKSAFFALSKKHHPDVPDHKSKPQFHEITQAYNVLRDPVSKRAYDNTLPSVPRQDPSTLHSRHLSDTAARYRRSAAARSSPPPSQTHSSSPSTSRTRPHPSSSPNPPFPRRRPDPLPGAHDRHNRHPGQRYKPPDPVAQAAAWAVKKELMREQKTRTQRYVTGMMLGIGALFGAGWIVGRSA